MTPAAHLERRFNARAPIIIMVIVILLAAARNRSGTMKGSLMVIRCGRSRS